MKLSEIKIDRKDSRYIVLIILFGILLFALYRHYFGQQINSEQYSKKGEQKAEVVTDPYFNIDVLKPKEDANSQTKRNPFAPGQPPPPPPGSQPVQVEERPEEPMGPPAPPPPPPDPVPQEPPEMANLKVFGVLNQDGKDMYAFLSDGKEVYVVRKDDIFANQYKITQLDEDKIEISTIKGNFKKTLTISGG